MTDFGVTPDGFVRKLFTDIIAAVGAKQQAAIASTLKTDDSKTVIGNLNNIFADELSQAWEALEAAANGMDPDNAVDYLFEALCQLSGVVRRQPIGGTATATVVATGTFPPGAMVAHVVGDPTNLWANANTVIGSGNAQFNSLATGAAAIAPAGELTVIAQPLSGWTSITNSADAVPGRDLESIAQLRIRRELSLAEAGSTTVPGLAADLTTNLAAGTSAKIRENPLDYFAGGLPAHSINVILVSSATNDQIAQEIYAAKGAGVITVGGQTGAAIDVNGAAVSPAILFDRGLAVAVDVDVTIPGGFDAVDVQTAVTGAFPEQLGATVRIAFLEAAVLSLGVADVAMTLNRGSGPVDANVAMSLNEIAIPGTISVHN